MLKGAAMAFSSSAECPGWIGHVNQSWCWCDAVGQFWGPQRLQENREAVRNSVTVMLWSNGHLSVWATLWAGGTRFLAMAQPALASPACFGAEVRWLGLEQGLCCAEPSPASWRGFHSALQGGGSYLTFSADLFLHYLPF